MSRIHVLTLLLAALCCAPAHAVSFDWAAVGNPGNAGEWSGESHGGYGPDAIVGGVNYNYRISKHEVNAGQYTEFLNAVAASDPHGLYSTEMWSNQYGCKIERLGTDGSYVYSMAADRENRPVNFVSFLDAMRFTNWLENGQGSGGTESGVYTISDGLSEVRNPDATYFIPSEDEWYKAAYHKNDGVTSNYFDFPTSSDNWSSNDLVDPDPGNNANFFQFGGYTIGSPYYLTNVGEFENSESPYGTFDQGGNVWEWNEELYASSSRGLRGGGWGNSSSLGMKASTREFINQAYEEGHIGFRVATVPEPTTPALIALGLCLVPARRRRA